MTRAAVEERRRVFERMRRRAIRECRGVPEGMGDSMNAPCSVPRVLMRSERAAR